MKKCLQIFVSVLIFFPLSLPAQQQGIAPPFEPRNDAVDLAAARVSLAQVFRYRLNKDGVPDSTIVQENYYDSLGRVYRTWNMLAETLFYYEGNHLVKVVVSGLNSVKRRTVYRYKFQDDKLVAQSIVDSASGDSTHYTFQYRNGNLHQVWRRKAGEKQSFLFREYSYIDNRVSSIQFWNGRKPAYLVKVEYAENITKGFVQQRKKWILYLEEERDAQERLMRKTVFATVDENGRVAMNPLPVTTTLVRDASSLAQKIIHAYFITTSLSINQGRLHTPQLPAVTGTITDVYHYFSFQTPDTD